MGLLDWFRRKTSGWFGRKKKKIRKLLPRRSRVTKLLVRYCGEHGEKEVKRDVGGRGRSRERWMGFPE
jgi:hypothetical protein